MRADPAADSFLHLEGLQTGPAALQGNTDVRMPRILRAFARLWVWGVAYPKFSQEEARADLFLYSGQYGAI